MSEAESWYAQEDHLNSEADDEVGEIKVESVSLPPFSWKPSCLDLAILAAIGVILLALLFPGGVRSRSQGQLTSCKSNLRNLSTALEMYASDDQGGHYPPNLDRLLPKHLRAIPQCPAAPSSTYEYSSSITSKGFTVWCHGGHHHSAGILGDYPQYSSFRGLILP